MISITVDYDVWLEAKQKLDNISQEVNELLKQRLNVKEGDLPSDKDMISREITKLEGAKQALKKKLERVKKKEKEEKGYTIEEYMKRTA